jgi:hypothetical protein
MASSSLLTQISENTPLARAHSTVLASRDLPASVARFFPGSRFDPPRAGMMQSGFARAFMPVL